MSMLLVSWGGLAPDERKARLRALGALVHVFVGRRGEAFEGLLRECEDEPGKLAAADLWFGHVAAIPQRRILAVLGQFCRTDRALSDSAGALAASAGETAA